MKRNAIILVCILVIVFGVALLRREIASAPENTPAVRPSTNNNSAVQEIPGFDKKQYSLDDPNSPWVVVNKKRPLPSDFAPKDLAGIGNGEQMRVSAATSLNNLLVSAKRQGINLSPISGYRSYVTQSSVYGSYVKKDGQTAADTYSARPGHSEHQTGLAVDLGNGVCDLQICFGDTPAGKWLSDHAAEYGFIIRYQKDSESLTGYQYEPWHIRYVGTDLANELKKSNQTLEQFVGLPTSSNY